MDTSEMTSTNTELRSKIEAVVGSTVLTILITIVSVYLFGEYGYTLFIAAPFIVGVLASVIYGRSESRTRKQCRKIAFLSLFAILVALLVFAIEGIICIIMASPLVVLLTYMGAELGYYIQAKNRGDDKDKMMSLWPLLFLMVPATLGYDVVMSDRFDILPVTTTIEIDAPPEIVWNEVVDFSPLAEPEEWLFQSGIAYPQDACIDGHGVGAIRYCNFTTGSFVEPITVWDEPRRLAFSVEEQPIPMTELSPYQIEPYHLHGYFVSTKGQFLLERLPDNRTLLTGTTWYYNKIRPVAYWRIWSDYIIHSIHNRVLVHVKQESEKAIIQ